MLLNLELFVPSTRCFAVVELRATRRRKRKTYYYFFLLKIGLHQEASYAMLNKETTKWEIRSESKKWKAKSGNLKAGCGKCEANREKWEVRRGKRELS